METTKTKQALTTNKRSSESWGHNVRRHHTKAEDEKAGIFIHIQKTSFSEYFKTP